MTGKKEKLPGGDLLEFAAEIKVKLEKDPNYKPVLIGSEIKQGLRGMVYKGTNIPVKVDDNEQEEADLS